MKPAASARVIHISKHLMIIKQKKKPAGKKKKEIVQSRASGSWIPPLPSCMIYFSANKRNDSLSERL